MNHVPHFEFIIYTEYVKLLKHTVASLPTKPISLCEKETNEMGGLFEQGS